MCLSLCRAAAFSLLVGNAVIPLSRVRRRPGLRHLQRFKSEIFFLWQQSWFKRRSREEVPGWQCLGPEPIALPARTAPAATPGPSEDARVEGRWMRIGLGLKTCRK